MPNQNIHEKITPNFIDGDFQGGHRSKMEVLSPIDGRQISEVVLSTSKDLDKAVEAAEKAIKAKSSQSTESDSQPEVQRVRPLSTILLV